MDNPIGTDVTELPRGSHDDRPSEHKRDDSDQDLAKALHSPPHPSLIANLTRDQARHKGQRLVNDRRIAENTLRIPHPYGIADAQRFITGVNASSGETVFLIVRRDDTVLGACGVAERPGDSPELGYWLAFAFWGNGYATEAARAVIDYAFDDLGYEMLHAGARASNPASRRVLEKCGLSGRESSSIASARSPRPHHSIDFGSTAGAG